MPDTLTLERAADHHDQSSLQTPSGGTVMVTPAIDENYWAYRVQLSDTQAILGFSKFGGIGIGFAVEADWNSNLPYVENAESIFAHISHNKGNDSISDEDCVEAIQMIQKAVAEDRNHDFKGRCEVCDRSPEHPMHQEIL